MDNLFGKSIFAVFKEHRHGFSTLYGVFSEFSVAYEEMKTLVTDKDCDYTSLYKKALDVKDGEEAVLLYTCYRREAVNTVFENGVPRIEVIMTGVDVKDNGYNT